MHRHYVQHRSTICRRSTSAVTRFSINQLTVRTPKEWTTCPSVELPARPAGCIASIRCISGLWSARFHRLDHSLLSRRPGCLLDGSCGRGGKGGATRWLRSSISLPSIVRVRGRQRWLINLTPAAAAADYLSPISIHVSRALVPPSCRSSVDSITPTTRPSGRL